MHLTQLKPAAVLHFSSYDQLIQAAVAGQGVALGRLPLIERPAQGEEAGRAVRRRGGLAEGLLHARSAPARRGARGRRLHAWLAAEARAPGSARRGVERALDRPHHRQRH
jgi:hypothetical protein